MENRNLETSFRHQPETVVQDDLERTGHVTFVIALNNQYLILS